MECHRPCCPPCALLTCLPGPSKHSSPSPLGPTLPYDLTLLPLPHPVLGVLGEGHRLVMLAGLRETEVGGIQIETQRPLPNAFFVDSCSQRLVWLRFHQEPNPSLISRVYLMPFTGTHTHFLCPHEPKCSLVPNGTATFDQKGN